MPIYAYKCAACGHADDVLQKISAAALTVCPACGQSAYSKQVTAPQFQLKGSGWYVTDFRGGNNATGKTEAAKADAAPAESAGGEGKDKAPAKTESGATDGGKTAAASCAVHGKPAAAPAPAKAANN